MGTLEMLRVWVYEYVQAPLLLLPLSRFHHFNCLSVGKTIVVPPHVGAQEKSEGHIKKNFGRRFAPAFCPPLANCFRRHWLVVDYIEATVWAVEDSDSDAGEDSEAAGDS